MTKHKRIILWLVLIISLVLWLPNTGSSVVEAQRNVKAFPGAEGYGTDTTHGRGGRVIYVTNLNDDGPGSLRDAIEASGPRIVMFATSGTIRLDDVMRIKNPYIYIAGQTAPGDGIAVEGAGFSVQTHDVLIRYMRLRPGDNRRGSSPQSRDGITVSERGIYNVVIDHNSFSWGVDENASIGTQVSDVTYSWNIISEALLYSIHPKGKHSMGMLIGRSSDRISIHHNLYAHNNERNPLMASGSHSDVVNNVIYNWGKQATTSSDQNDTGDAIFGNLIGNYYKAGPDSEPWEFMIFQENKAPDPRSRYYLSGNIGPNRPNDNMDEWALSRFDERSYRTNQPHEAAPVTIWSAEEAYERVLASAGATLPKRDAVDRRVVNDVRNGTGRIIDAVNETPGFPVLRPARAPQDSDQDGMPDAWEAERGLNPNNANDGARDRDNDGYTNIEEYIIGLTNETITGDAAAAPLPEQPTLPEIESPIGDDDDDGDVAVVDGDDDDDTEVPVVDNDANLPSVTALILVDAQTDRDIRQLNNNDTLNLRDLPNRLTIRAEGVGNIGSIQFGYLGDNTYRTESVAPYALNGDNKGNYSAANLPVGSHTLVATPYTRSGASGRAGTPMSINFTIVEQNSQPVVVNPPPSEPVVVNPPPSEPVVVDPPQQPQPDNNTNEPTVSRFMLVDARTNRDIRQLSNNDTLNLAELPDRLSIRADVVGDVESVKFRFQGDKNYRTENTAPYALNGDNKGNYTRVTFRMGQNLIAATPYSRDSRRGQKGDTLTVRFTVINERQVVSQPANPPSNNDNNGGNSGNGNSGNNGNSSNNNDRLSVTQLMLVDAKRDRDIRPVRNGETLYLDDLPDDLTIRAITTNDVESVVFGYQNDNRYRTESSEPFTINGDTKGNFRKMRLQQGQNTVKATPYARSGGRGTKGDTVTIRFTIRDTAPQTVRQPNNDDRNNNNNRNNPDPLTVTQLMLVDAKRDRDIRPIRNGETLYLGDLPDDLTIRAVTTDDVESVVFGYQNDNRHRTENSAPFTINGDTKGNFREMRLRQGQNTVKATGYARTGGRGSKGDTLTVRFTIRNGTGNVSRASVDQPNTTTSGTAPEVTSLVLVDARTNQDIRFLNNGDSLILSQLPRQMTVRANVAGNVGSVVFNYRDNPTFQVENDAPFALSGDDDGDFRPTEFDLGQIVLMVTPYTGRNGEGTPGQPMVMGLVVIENPETEAPPVAAVAQAQPTQVPQIQVTVVEESNEAPAPQLQVENVGSGNSNPPPANNNGGNNNPPPANNGGNNNPPPANNNGGNNNSGDLRIVSVYLIDANTGRDIAQVTEGATLPLSRVPDELNFRANVSGPVDSVVFTFTGRPGNQTEEEAPYTLAGNNEDGYHSVRGLSAGDRHTITVTAYSEPNGRGRSSATYRVSFNVVK